MAGSATKNTADERCAPCQAFTLMSLSGGTEYKHQPTLTALRDSATDGCDFCKLLWHCFIQSSGESLAAAMELGNQQIMIKPNSIMRPVPTMPDFLAFDELWIDVGEDKAESEVSVSVRLELFTLRKNSMSSVFLGRDITPEPSSQDNFDDINEWIYRCSRHRDCQTSSNTLLPSRVLDVGLSDSIESRLVITNGQVGKYLCLSYCWGLSPGITTTYDSVHTHTKGVPDECLPATLRDAICITRRLGYQYLWIDALCILQPRPGIKNDPEAFKDWQNQSSKMADTYGNAFLTIIAADATDKDQGCFIARVRDPNICRVSLGDNDTSEIFAREYYLNPLRKAAIETRAWTFQEMALSPRKLIFGRELSFQCRTCTYWERMQSPSPIPGPGTIWAAKASPFKPPIEKSSTIVNWRVDDTNIFSGPKPTKSQLTLRDHTIVQWYTSLDFQFCGRQLTNEMDILPALSGVAHRVQDIIGGEYYAGIWEFDLPRGLLWKPKRPLHIGKDRWLTRPTRYRAPSWSWASVKGQINYGFYERQLKIWGKERDKYPCRILEVKTELVGPVYDPMGQVSGGWIKICAPVKKAIFVPTTVNPFRIEVRDSHGNVRLFDMQGNDNLLVGADVPDRSDPQAVGAIGNFDTAEECPENLLCVLLTMKEGLLLIRVNDSSGEFRRVGIFKLHRISWFEGYENQNLTII